VLMDVFGWMVMHIEADNGNLKSVLKVDTNQWTPELATELATFIEALPTWYAELIDNLNAHLQMEADYDGE